MCEVADAVVGVECAEDVDGCVPDGGDPELDGDDAVHEDFLVGPEDGHGAKEGHEGAACAEGGEVVAELGADFHLQDASRSPGDEEQDDEVPSANESFQGGAEEEQHEAVEEQVAKAAVAEGAGDEAPGAAGPDRKSVV